VWAVAAGQAMNVKIVERRQQNVLLHVLSLEPSE